MNRFGSYIFTITLALVASGWMSSATAADCGLVYDEFDSLMNRDFLVSPEKFVKGFRQKISRRDYNSRQKGKLRLWSHRKGLGVGIVKTNKGRYGKFLYTWGKPSNGSTGLHLLVKELTLFTDVNQGKRPRRFKDINLPSSYTLDVDTGRISKGKASDIWFNNVDGKNMSVQARNGARLFFPETSLCDPVFKLQTFNAMKLQSGQLTQLAQIPSKQNTASRTINKKGNVVFHLPDGTTIEYYDGGHTTSRPGNQPQIVLYSTQAPAAIPPEVPDQTHFLWLESHSTQLLGILRSLVNDDQGAIDNFLQFEGNGASVYERIQVRGKTIGRLLRN